VLFGGDEPDDLGGRVLEGCNVSASICQEFEIIGEATKQLNEEFRKRHSKIPWSYMAKMRDKLIHHYFGIDYQMVWRTVVEDVPELKASVRTIVVQAQSGSRGR